MLKYCQPEIKRKHNSCGASQPLFVKYQIRGNYQSPKPEQLNSLLNRKAIHELASPPLSPFELVFSGTYNFCKTKLNASWRMGTLAVQAISGNTERIHRNKNNRVSNKKGMTQHIRQSVQVTHGYVKVLIHRSYISIFKRR